MNSYIIRYGELALKGRNRNIFEKRLAENIKWCLKNNKLKYNKFVRKRGRFFVYGNSNYDVLKYVFGITSISKAVEISANLEQIKKQIKKQLKNKKFRTFRVSTRKSDSKLKQGSMEVDAIVGKFILQNFKNKKVSLKNFDLEVSIELKDDKAYVFTEIIQAIGGLPLATAGNVVCLLEDKYSLLASFLMMKRGCHCIFAVKKKIDGLSYNQSTDWCMTNPEKRRRDRASEGSEYAISLLTDSISEPFDVKLLREFYYGRKFRLLSIKNPDEINKIAETYNCKTLIVNDNMKNIKNYKTKLAILRPLVAFTKKQMDGKLKWLKKF